MGEAAPHVGIGVESRGESEVSVDINQVSSMCWDGLALSFIDQRRLPAELHWVRCETATAVSQAIREMVVRGAPAIGIAAAWGAVLAARARLCDGRGDRIGLLADLDELAASRPTAVNLFWALDRVRAALARISDAEAPAALEALARAIHEEDVAMNRRMAEFGAALIEPGKAVLTHCNTGALATGGIGTALGVIRAAWQQQRISDVYADETRPWLQGARLTAWELVQESIPVTLICEGAAASLLRTGRVGWVIVGADRIAANGDTANKIGTYGLAVLARRHGVRFMVVAPGSTVDMTLPDGSGIPIEERPEDEVLSLAGRRIAAPGARAWNPSFDVTPAELIDAIVTERGVVASPDAARMARLFGGG